MKIASGIAAVLFALALIFAIYNTRKEINIIEEKGQATIGLVIDHQYSSKRFDKIVVVFLHQGKVYRKRISVTDCCDRFPIGRFVKLKYVYIAWRDGFTVETSDDALIEDSNSLSAYLDTLGINIVELSLLEAELK